MQELLILKDETVITPIALVDSDGLVIMFHTGNIGTVIQSDGHFPIGHTSDWQMGLGTWKPFHGTITINIK